MGGIAPDSEAAASSDPIRLLIDAAAIRQVLAACCGVPDGGWRVAGREIVFTGDEPIDAAARGLRTVRGRPPPVCNWCRYGAVPVWGL